jgi:hypothetical protein
VLAGLERPGLADDRRQIPAVLTRFL